MEELQKELKSKFFELSEVFTDEKKRCDIEPEQKCGIVKTMLEIYNTLNTSSVDDMLDIKNS